LVTIHTVISTYCTLMKSARQLNSLC
jgi:hypothetical protein